MRTFSGRCEPWVLAVLGVITPAFGQEPPKSVERVLVTGSSIKRVQTEGALPLQVITREEIDRLGIISAEQLMEYISANGNGTDNLSSNTFIVGVNEIERRNNNGNASANLRGLGAGSTLVLLNGRRVSTHGLKANSVDLSSIPLAAVERVEILKDGASAIYGSDAIGGVINFILRRDYSGVQLSVFADVTEEGGGNRYRAAILAGSGDLGRERYNVMASLNFDRQEALGGLERTFSNGYQPDRGLSPDTIGGPFATQAARIGSALPAFRVPGGVQEYGSANLLNFQGRCDTIPLQSAYEYLLWGLAGTQPSRFACAWDYGASRNMIQPIDRWNFASRGTLALTRDDFAFFELVGSRTTSRRAFEPLQIPTTLGAGSAYPVGGPYYQDLSQYVPGFDRTRPIAYNWRCMDCGLRTIETESDNYRVLAGIEGTLGTWDYRLGASSAASGGSSTFAGGYYYTAPLNALLGSGILNPWLLPGQTQTQAALDALAAARADGVKYIDGDTRLLQFDGGLSGEMGDFGWGMLTGAFGLDYRRESYAFGSYALAQPPIMLAPFDTALSRVTRTIKAGYGEVAVPLGRALEVTAAVRRDDYSDFGGTTNPKVSVAFRPAERLLLRGSWGTGFHAPGFVQLYGPVNEGTLPGSISDPVLCPQNPGDPRYCSIRPPSRGGSNPDLQPETSKQWSVGFAVEPVESLFASADLWQTERDDRIYSLTPQEVVANWTTFPEYLVRGSDGRLDGPGGYIRSGFVNAAGEITRGVDVTLRVNWLAWNAKWTARLEGTYLDSYRARVFATDPWTELAGQWDRRDLHSRWKHTAALTYSRGPWSGSLINRYVRGYKDEKPMGTIPPGFKERVDDYVTWDLMFDYTGFRGLSLVFGVKNALNTDPPFTAHNVDFTSGAGWDPRVADPRLRAYQARVTYDFK